MTSSNQEGLTKIYSRFHDRNDQGADICSLRKIQTQLDEELIRSYDWIDLDLGHGFHPTKQGIRYTISDSARRTVLDRLLALNHQRYEEEVKAGLHDKGKAKARPTRAVTKPVAEPAMSGAQLGFLLDPVPRKPTSAEPVSTVAVAEPDTLDPHAAALLAALQRAYFPFGKADLLKMCGIPPEAWAGALQTLKDRGLVEQTGEKRGAKYARKRS